MFICKCNTCKYICKCILYTLHIYIYCVYIHTIHREGESKIEDRGIGSKERFSSGWEKEMKGEEGKGIKIFKIEE